MNLKDRMGLMRFLLLATLSFLIFAFSNTVLAQEATFSASYSASMAPTGNNIGVSKITPASFFYFLKTVRENLEMKLAFTPHVRSIRQLEFATRRLREVKSLIPTHQDLIPVTLERYWAHISYLRDDNLKDQEIATRVKESLVVHLEVLGQIYNQLTDKKAKMSVRSMINRIVQREDLPIFGRIPACRFLQKEATSSSLLEVERQILLQRAIDCFKRAGF